MTNDLIKDFYEGDTLILHVDLSGHNLPDNPDVTFVLDIGNGKVIKKTIGSDGVIKLSERDTLGLDGVYCYEIRVNNAGLTKVLLQSYLRINDSITVSGEPINAVEKNDLKDGDETCDPAAEHIKAISISDIKKLF